MEIEAYSVCSRVLAVWLSFVRKVSTYMKIHPCILSYFLGGNSGEVLSIRRGFMKRYLSTRRGRLINCIELHVSRFRVISVNIL